jgi:hypothetical protein
MKMKSEKHGRNTSELEVTNISLHGFWILVDEKEYFLPFKSFPWFRQAKLDDILNVKLFASQHLYWPALDIDLTIDIIDNPGKYPLVFK